MNILLSRILTYINGSFVFDDYYRFGKFVVYNYLGFEDLTFDDVISKSGLSPEAITGFCQLFGYEDFTAFQNELFRMHMVRLDQIRARMLGVNSDQLINDMEKSCSNEEMKAYVSTICEAIFKAKRVVLFGAMYPLSIAVELQTDLITFGKPVIQYQSFDQDLKLDENDVTIFITATGRSMNAFVEIKKDLRVSDTTSILITQNPTYELDEYKISDYVLRVPGKFDGINFNYQIMTLCDLLRVHYYTQYYL